MLARRGLSSDDRNLASFSMKGVERIYSVLVMLDPIIERPFIRQYLNEQFQGLRANSACKETITPLFAMHISDVERLLRYTNARPFAHLLREFARGTVNAPGAIGRYVLPKLERKGVKPGRDTIREHIDRMVREFEGVFKDRPSKPQG
jgi:hypothetical protein